MKKILLFTPRYFGYESIIVDRLSKQDYDVSRYDDRPSQSILKKSVLRVAPKLLAKYVDKYFDFILRKNKDVEFDLVFVILGQCFTEKILQKFKVAYPNAKFVLYMRDSIKNFPNTLKIMNYFDYCYSFDSDDCERYKFIFLPLFYSYSRDFIKVDEQQQYDVSCICTVKKGKYLKLMKIKKSFNCHFNNNFFFFYLQSKIVFFFLKLTCLEFKKAKLKDFQYKKLSYMQNLGIINNSKMVVDVQMANQSGLTMRTFETLSLGKKLITTNKNIKKYDFYDERLIYVIPDNLEINFEDNFFKTNFNVSDEFMIKYNLDNWLKKLLEGE